MTDIEKLKKVGNPEKLVRLIKACADLSQMSCDMLMHLQSEENKEDFPYKILAEGLKRETAKIKLCIDILPEDFLDDNSRYSLKAERWAKRLKSGGIYAD